MAKCVQESEVPLESIKGTNNVSPPVRSSSPVCWSTSPVIVGYLVLSLCLLFH